MAVSLTLRSFILSLTVAAVFIAYHLSPSPSTARQPKTHLPSMSLSSKLSITDLKLEGERVLIRVDFNVP